MAKEEYVVFFDVKAAGNLAPAVWKEKTLKVGAISGAASKEKNEGAPYRAPGNLKTAAVQECKMVTVIAESEEEAALAVAKFYACGGAGATPEVLETAGAGPRTSNFTNGKMAAVLTTNFKELSVI